MTKVLVGYASKHHSTAEIADAIAGELRSTGLAVDCLDVAGDVTLTEYDAVVVGSAVYMGRWRKEAAAFLKDNSEALISMPFWIFSSGPVGEDVEAQLAGNDAWMEPRRVLELAQSMGVRGHVVFGGRMPQDPHGFVEKSMVRRTPEQLRDARDWPEIRRWAASVAGALVSPG